MRRNRWWKFARTTCQTLQVVTYIGMGVVGGAKLADASKAGAFGPIVMSAQHAIWWLLPLLYVLNLGFQFAARQITPPWVWDAVKAILDQLQVHAFGQRTGDLQQSNRVTLFKHVGWRWSSCRWPWSGWLVPVERSGHTTRKTNTAFLAPDDGANAEGVAGRAWACKGTVSVYNLPDITDASPEGDLQQYAEQTFISIEALKQRLKPKKRVALSLIAFHVEVKNKVWGVIVFDTRKKEPFADEAIEQFRLVGVCLGKILGGAGK